MKSRKSLVISTFYGINDDNLLPDDLSEFLNRHNYQTYVLLLDWNRKYTKKIYRKNGIIVFCYTSQILKKAAPIKWLFASLFSYFFYRKCLKKKYDLLICYSPLITSWFYVLKFWKIKKKALFYFDFFPIHNYQIGKINKKLVPLLYEIEHFLVSKFDFVGCMSQANINFFLKYFKVKNHNIVKEVPLWKATNSPPSLYNGSDKFKEKYNIESNDLLLLFGGQLEVGRGIEFLCSFADEIQKNGINATVIVLGDGSLRSIVVEHEKVCSKMKYLGKVSKSEYQYYLNISDIGLAITVSQAQVPTYPSKIIEYAFYGLPILANIESYSDVGTIIHDHNAGFVSHAGDLSQFVNDLVKLIPYQQRMLISENSKKLFLERHEINHALALFKKFIDEE
jgi:glycosyltransferase involved in cell wall biosynthesis